jgi:hypothetical protein
LTATDACTPNGATFTASGGNGTYVWSGTNINGSGSVATSGTGPGKYTAGVLSRASGAGLNCDSMEASIESRVRAPGSKGARPDPICGCEDQLTEKSGACIRNNMLTTKSVPWSNCEKQCIADGFQGWYNTYPTQETCDDIGVWTAAEYVWTGGKPQCSTCRLQQPLKGPYKGSCDGENLCYCR